MLRVWPTPHAPLTVRTWAPPNAPIGSGRAQNAAAYYEHYLEHYCNPLLSRSKSETYTYDLNFGSSERMAEVHFYPYYWQAQRVDAEREEMHQL